MARMSFEIAHTLSPEEALRRVEALVGYWSGKYGIAATWTGNRAHLVGKAVGVTLVADLEVGPGRVSGEATDPGRLLRAQAQKYLTRKFTTYLDPSRTVEAILGAE